MSIEEFYIHNIDNVMQLMLMYTNRVYKAQVFLGMEPNGWIGSQWIENWLHIIPVFSSQQFVFLDQKGRILLKELIQLE